jgi:hypothetical protein
VDLEPAAAGLAGLNRKKPARRLQPLDQLVAWTRSTRLRRRQKAPHRF